MKDGTKSISLHEDIIIFDSYKKSQFQKISLTNVNALIIIMNVNRIVIVLSDKLDLLNYKVYEIVRIFYS